MVPNGTTIKRMENQRNKIPDAFLEWLLDELVTGGHLKTEYKATKNGENTSNGVKSRNGAKNALKTRSERVSASKGQNPTQWQGSGTVKSSHVTHEKS